MAKESASQINLSITLTDNSPEVLDALGNAIDRAFDSIGEVAVGHAKEILENANRVDTGRLVNSIDTAHDDQSVVIGTNVEYAIWHEVGTGIYASDGTGRQTPWAFQDANGEWHYTRGVKPLHYLRRAFSEHTNEYKNIIKESLENA